MVGTVLVWAAATHALAPDFYYRSVQEDEALEWSSFWAFALALLAYTVAALRWRRQSQRLPWFLAGLALFCSFVALEEISWGQRLVGYRPPTYFLEHNFQQELNLHNVVADWLRQGAFFAVVFGYGLVLPLAFLPSSLARLGARLGVVPPALALAPSFVATGILYAVYPWTHSGEWAELMLGSGMLFAALTHVHESAGARGVGRPLAATLGLGFATAVLLGTGTARAWWALASGAPERVEAARVELDALREDIASARTRTRCGLHKRLYSIVEGRDQRHLQAGAFAELVGQGLPEERARFLLDPWNSPYWLRHVCSEDRTRRAIFVYSLGPNRLRDSTRWEIVEDDLGAFVSRPAQAPE